MLKKTNDKLILRYVLTHLREEDKQELISLYSKDCAFSLHLLPLSYHGRKQIATQIPLICFVLDLFSKMPYSISTFAEKFSVLEEIWNKNTFCPAIAVPPIRVEPSP